MFGERESDQIDTPGWIDLKGMRLRIRRAGKGGVPLLLLHGFPCTSFIWTKVLDDLALHGFDAVAPDFRGYGESDFAGDDRYDLAAFSDDLVDLAAALGWNSMIVAGHDLGAIAALDLSNRAPALVSRLVLLNHPVPYDGPPVGPQWPPGYTDAVFDYARRQAHEADQLLAELSTAQARHEYIAGFYTHRMWCPPGAFSPDDLKTITQSYRDPHRMRIAFRDYEIAAGRRDPSAPDLARLPVHQPVLILFGPEDATQAPNAFHTAVKAHPNLVGPFIVPDAGHYLQWEQPAIFVKAVVGFNRDLLP